MSNKKTPKVVKITEDKLATLIEKIVAEAVAEKKKVWIQEQKAKQTKTLEETIEKIVESKLKTKK